MSVASKTALVVASFLAFAGAAYADGPQPPANQPNAASQLSYSSPGAAANPVQQPGFDHFAKPPGYDQDRRNYPYGPGYGPKAN